MTLLLFFKRYIDRELRWLQDHYTELIESQCEQVKREESFFKNLVGGEAAPQIVLRTLSLEIALDMIHANESALAVRRLRFFFFPSF